MSSVSFFLLIIAIHVEHKGRQARWNFIIGLPCTMDVAIAVDPRTCRCVRLQGENLRLEDHVPCLLICHARLERLELPVHVLTVRRQVLHCGAQNCVLLSKRRRHVSCKQRVHPCLGLRAHNIVAHVCFVCARLECRILRYLSSLRDQITKSIVTKSTNLI